MAIINKQKIGAPVANVSRDGKISPGYSTPTTKIGTPPMASQFPGNTNSRPGLKPAGVMKPGVLKRKRQYSPAQITVGKKMGIKLK